MKSWLLKNAAFCAVAAGVASNLGAVVSDEEVLRLYGGAVKSGVSVSVESRKRLDNERFEQITLLFQKGGYQRREAVFSDGEMLFLDLIDPKTGVSYQNRFEEEQKTQALQRSYAALKAILPKLQVVELVSDPKNPYVYLFTDPLCKYCREAMKNHENDLKSVNFRVILAPIDRHGEEAMRKSVKIIQESKKAKTLQEKINIFKKYFDPQAPDPREVSQKAVRELQEQVGQIYRTGAIRGVPSVIFAEMLQ